MKKLLILFTTILVMALSGCTGPSLNRTYKIPEYTVYVELEKVRYYQEQTDSDDFSRQLDPLQMAAAFIKDKIFPEGTIGEDPVHQDELVIIKEGSQTIVEVKSEKTGITSVYLEQLAEKGRDGIWTVTGYDVDKERHPGISDIFLYDNISKVETDIKSSFEEVFHEEAAHYPEPFFVRQYENGFEIVYGNTSGNIYQITSTSPEGITNLGIKAGDSAEKVLKIYREKYIEPESVHGSKLYGVFKIENGQAIIFDFNIEDGMVNPGPIDDDDVLERIILTYPMFLDDSF